MPVNCQRPRAKHRTNIVVRRERTLRILYIYIYDIYDRNLCAQSFFFFYPAAKKKNIMDF